MKALVYTGIGHLEMMDVPDPETDFVMKVSGCGICGTDLKTYLKGHHFFPPPAILGHEFYGVVQKAPSGSGYSPGDTVVVAPYAECGVCALCRSGAGTLCKNKSFVEGGAFCEYVGIQTNYLDTGLFRIPAGDDAYTLVEPLACVLNGFEHLSLKPGSRALVVGSGPMGALFALLFRAKGFPVTVVEPGALRRETVASWGIDVTEPGNPLKGDYDNVVIAVNKKELVSDYVKAVADAGTVLMFSGLPKEDLVAIDAYSIHYREVSLTGSFGYAMRHFRQALALINDHKEEFSRVITHRLPLSEGAAAFDLLSSGQAFKIILKP
ncbi:MAG TPA: alcohol dehydrogenase catalytic domain-containing protein [Rectinemataceae bacterium]|nr:alcohol dehydrogenase catalytic domain-containing protein [Rectinemataceae bacterium]